MHFICQIILIGLFFTGCGPSDKYLEAKRIVDSTRKSDSLAMVLAEKQRIVDSIDKSRESNSVNGGSNKNSNKDAFTIEKITKAEFSKRPSGLPNVFELRMIVRNISTYRFSSVDIDGEVFFTMKDESHVNTLNDPERVVHFNGINPNDTMDITYRFYVYEKFERTPVSIDLELKCNAISVDIEIKKTIQVYNLLPSWIEAQKNYGLR